MVLLLNSGGLSIVAIARFVRLQIANLLPHA